MLEHVERFDEHLSLYHIWFIQTRDADNVRASIDSCEISINTNFFFIFFLMKKAHVGTFIQITI